MPDKVKPGDLITADFVNGLIDMMNELEHRVEVLESNTDAIQSIRITGFDPPPPPDGAGQNLGQILRIYGENFAWPSRNNTVTIQNFMVTSGGVATVNEFRPGSSPQQLEFPIPTGIAGIQEGGTEVTITVETGAGSAQRNYRLLPALPTTGDPPSITAIRNASGGVNLTVGQQAIITGQNFRSTPAENQITFIVPTADDGESRYPVTPSAVNLGSGPEAQDEIRLTVPDMEEVDFNGIDVTIELQIGNFPALEEIVFVST
jgi:hypothetical protein